VAAVTFRKRPRRGAERGGWNSLLLSPDPTPPKTSNSEFARRISVRQQGTASVDSCAAPSATSRPAACRRCSLRPWSRRAGRPRRSRRSPATTAGPARPSRASWCRACTTARRASRPRPRTTWPPPSRGHTRTGASCTTCSSSASRASAPRTGRRATTAPTTPTRPVTCHVRLPLATMPLATMPLATRFRLSKRAAADRAEWVGA